MEQDKKNQADQKQQQQGKDIQTTVSDSGFITGEVEIEEEEETKAGDEEPDANQMRVEHPVALGREWSVQPNLASGGVNNLNSTISIATATANNPPQKNAPQNSNSATTTTTTTKSTVNPNINIMNAWEQFYQQNDDGDT